MTNPGYWFPAKRHGWGWGPPVTWQGWVVMIIWLAATLAGSVHFGPQERPLQFAAFLLVMLAVMFAICYVKGETPRWTSGDRGGDDQARS